MPVTRLKPRKRSHSSESNTHIHCNISSPLRSTSCSITSTLTSNSSISADLCAIAASNGPVAALSHVQNTSASPCCLKRPLKNSSCTFGFWARETVARSTAAVVARAFIPRHHPAGWQSTSTVFWLFTHPRAERRRRRRFLYLDDVHLVKHWLVRCADYRRQAQQGWLPTVDHLRRSVRGTPE